VPPRAAKVPFSSGEHRDFAIPECAWSRIEASYGRELPSSARDQFSKATAHYVDMAAAEQAAPSALPARDRLVRLRKLATDLHAELDERNSFAAGRPEFYADQLIYFHLQHPGATTEALRPGREHLLLAPVAGDLQRFIAACDAAASEMEATSKPGYWREGSAWNNWIDALSRIAEAHGLPTAATETIKIAADELSPFVPFVAALQETLPAELRRSTGSLVALTGSIKRARKGTRTRHRSRRNTSDR
jgi:uncharacterized membrane protein YccC